MNARADHEKRLRRNLLLVLVGLLAACSPPLTVEQKVIGVIRDMEARIEAGERRPFMANVALDFNGQDGITTRDQLNAMVLYQLNRHQRVQAQFFPIHVTPTGTGLAEANFGVLLTGGQGWLPDSGQMYQITTRWQEQDGKWLLHSARWKAVSIESVLE